MALSRVRVVGSTNRYPRVRTAKENTQSTLPSARLHYPKCQDRPSEKYSFQNGITVHPTNPKVAACQAPVFSARFGVSVLEVNREHIRNIFSGVRPLFLCQPHELRKNMPRYVFPHWIFGVTHKSRRFRPESGDASVTIRKAATRSTR